MHESFDHTFQEAQRYKNAELIVTYCPLIVGEVQEEVGSIEHLYPKEGRTKLLLASAELNGDVYDSKLIQMVNLVWGIRVRALSPTANVLINKGDAAFLKPVNKNQAALSVAFVKQRLRDDPRVFRFCTQEGSADTSVGLWQEKCVVGDKPLEWAPEVNIERTYSLVGLNLPEVTQFLRTYKERMRQNAMYVRLKYEGNEFGWTGEGPRMPVTRWHLRATSAAETNPFSYDWTHHVRQLRTVLIHPQVIAAWESFPSVPTRKMGFRDPNMPSLAEAVLQPMMDTVAKDSGLGATFAQKKDDEHGLLISVAGTARHLFSGFFLPELPNFHPGDVRTAPSSRPVNPVTEAGSGNHWQPAVLLSAKAPSGAEAGEFEVCYFQSDPITDRCLCGLQYPKHIVGGAIQVAALRHPSAKWLQTQYCGSDRGEHWPWFLLCSPLFYILKPLNRNDLLEKTIWENDGLSTPWKTLMDECCPWI
jgi:hypothetical protein